MESIQILGKVQIKQIVTEQYKEKTSADFRKAIETVDGELANFDKDMNKTLTELTLKAHPQVEQLRRQFNLEREKIAAYKEQLLSSIKEIADLEMGTLVDSGEGNYLQEIRVGDNFAENTVCEVILKDDVVVEIRKK